MPETLRKCLHLLGPGKRLNWLVLIALSILVSLFEATGALLVFALLGMATEPDAAFDIPILGAVNDTFAHVPEGQLLTWAAVFLGAFFLVRAAAFLSAVYLQHRIAQNAAANLAIRLLGGYLRMPYELHLRRNSAELIRNAYDSVELLAKEVLVPAARIVSQVFVVIALAVVLLRTAPAATLLATVVLGPMVLLLFRVIQPRLKSLGRERQTMAQRSIQALQQSLQGMRDIKVLGRESFFKQDFVRQRKNLARALYLRGAAAEIPRTTMETTLILFILALFGLTVGTGQATGQALSVLGLFAYAALRLQPALNIVVEGLNSLKFATPAIDQLSDDLAVIEQAAREAGPQPKQPEPLPFSRLLQIEDVTFRYAGTEQDVLHNISLEIAAGETVGLVGATGGGKSTLLDIVLGLLRPTSGRVLVDGRDIHANVAAWQMNIGAVFQSVFLVDDSLRRNICLGLPDSEVDQSMLAEAVSVAQLSELVASLPEGLDTVVGERGVRLSGGQRQRVAIARAIYLQPSVLVFDEGTASLDTLTEAEIIRSLDSLREGRTTITVAHRLATVSGCDKIYMIGAGGILDSGTYDELLTTNADFRAMAGVT